MRLLLIPAVLILSALSGCLAPLQDALEFDAGDEPIPILDPGHIHLAYAPIADDYGAYQFQVPPNVEQLRLLAADEDGEEDGQSEEPPATEEPSEEDLESEASHFSLYTAAGKRVDATRASGEDFEYVLEAPEAGAYVLMLKGHLGHGIQIEIDLIPEDPPAESLVKSRHATGVFNAAILPLSPMVIRNVLVERGADADEEFSGRLRFPFVPDAFAFTYDGAGTTFSGSVSSRIGVVYEHDEMVPFGTGSGGAEPESPGAPCCGFGAFGAELEPDNLEGLDYAWEVDTDLVGEVALIAWLHQPAPVANVNVAVEEVADDDEESEAEDDEELEGPSGTVTADPIHAIGEGSDEYFFAGQAEPGSAYTFTVPDDAQALLLATSPASNDVCYYEYAAPCRSGSAARASLYDAEGRLGLFAVGEDQRLRMDGIAPGTYAIFVHPGLLDVHVGVVGSPPADGRLHEQRLAKLASVDVPLMQTEPFATTTNVEGLVMDVRFEVECPADRGYAFSAQVVSPLGAVYYAARNSVITFPSEACFSGDSSSTWLSPEAIVPGTYAVDVVSAGGIGDAQFAFFGLTTLNSAEADGEADEEDNRTPLPPSPLGRLRETVA